MKNFKRSLGTILIVAAAFSPLAQAGENWAEARYNRLTGSELTVRLSEDGHAIVGADVTQKNDGSGNFCRKYQATAPGAVPSYFCYTAVISGTDAKATYDGASSPELNAMFFLNDSPLVGGRWTERQVEASSVFLSDLLCVLTAPVVPNPIASYTCYSDLPSVGGGVSVGN